MIKRFLDSLAGAIDSLLKNINVRAARHRLARFPFIHETVRLGPAVQLIGPVDAFVIGEGSYVNDAIIVAGENAKVRIGANCAIGYRVSIKAVTHDINNPYPDKSTKITTVEQDISIGDRCWIGDNVYIKEGIRIGSNVIIGANSVVTRSVPDDQIVAGVPAKLLRENKPRSDR